MMTILKSEQRDPRLLHMFIRGLFGMTCRSYLSEYRITRLNCELRDGHSSRHRCGEVTWGYGDNWLEPYSDEWEDKA